MYETIGYDIDARVLTITLNRPERLNAFTTTMCEELIHAFDCADADDDVAAIIVTGAGRAFCAGADLSAGSATFDYANRPDRQNGEGSPVRADGSVDYAHPSIRDNGGRVSMRIYQSLKPVIGVINGPAIGIGVTMTLPMDVRIAADTARFGFVFSRRGIVPEAASSWFLPRVVGISRALEWCTSGRIFSAEEAKEGGLIRSIHPAEDLLGIGQAMAREIADNAAPVSVALTRQMMWRGLSQATPMEAHRLDSKLIYARGRAADAKEGVTAFLEKRPPHYPNTVGNDMPEPYPWWEEQSFTA
ncbi:crotonase/enoyl-CoA hydratase family protein [Sphingomonas sp. CA1-15]|uniref:Crotonase/enoyl-CoA hydratase family protein n=2 Tax=Sphingomonas immobilis TaxID=3063997 RepID=A0ABT8ZZW8_9SPHN|nr:crotonase/enoyl-CoA hydratase family protein [Sphingomonas sp. CA1-15]MDO7843121.1 crotonase/enoyl-CoA hydratase family protein [Sphingomonas sp. CA1-15]